MTPQSTLSPIDAETARARAELYQTLGQLRDRLDYAQRIDQACARTKQRLRTVQRTHPLAYLAVSTALVCVGGAAVWALASTLVRSLRR